MDPSGVVKTLIQPHRVVAGLERLDAPLKEDLQQVHTSHALADKLNHSTCQHLDLGLFLRRDFQRGRLLGSVKGKKWETSRLSWGRLVLAVEPGRLPATDRLREGDRWKTALPPRLDRQAPAQLDHLRPLVTRLSLLDRLRTTGKDVFEESPMGSTTQESLTHGDESSKVDNGVGSEVVELRSEEILETPEERMGRQRKPSVDVGG